MKEDFSEGIKILQENNFENKINNLYSNKNFDIITQNILEQIIDIFD